MADDVDDANERIEREQAALLANRPRPAQRETLAETCADCGEDIPLARSLAVPHTDVCSDCAADREVISKLRSRRGY